MATRETMPALERENLLTSVRLLGALVLAGLAEWALRTRNLPLDSALFLLGAVALFLWAAHREKAGGSWPPLPEEHPLTRSQWIAIGFSLLLGALAVLLFKDNRVPPLGLLLLAGAVGAVGLTGWRRLQRSDNLPARAPSERSDLLAPRVRHLALLGIVLLAAVFRLYLLETIPADMFNDLAHNYAETQRILDGQWMIYATSFPGREPLLFYLTALLTHVTGLSFYTLKLITALIGIATVPVVYLLGREAFNDAVGLVAALFLAVAKWHVLISRVGFRGILNPLVAALVILFLLRGLKRGRRSDFLWAGAWAGLGLYAYTAALAVIPASVLGLVLYALAGRARDLWRVRRSLLLAVLVALLVALPMLRFMLLDGREEFWFRPLTRVGETEATLPGPWGLVLLGNLARAAGMFHVEGDMVFRTNIPGDPHLDLVAGALFLLGFPLVLSHWRQGGNALILVFFCVMLLPTALALAFPREVPGAVRGGGAIATVMFFPAVAAVISWRRLGRVLPALCSQWGWGALLAGLALWSGLYNANLCFVEYPRVLPYGNYPLFGEIARVIDELGDDGPVFLKTIPHWDDKDAIRLQTQSHKNWGLGGEIIAEIDPAFFAALPVAQGAVIMQPERDPDSLRALKQIFPHGVTVYYRDGQGQPQFAVFLFRTDGGPP